MKMRVEGFWFRTTRLATSLLITAIAFPVGAQSDRYQPDLIPGEMVLELEAAREQRRARQLDAAIERLQALVEKESEYYLAWYNLGLAQVYSKQLDAGIKSLENALELKERHGLADDTIYNSVGWTHYLLGDYQAAKPVLEKAVEQKGLSERSRTKALNNLGSVLLRLQEYEAAEKALGQATEFGSTRAKVNLEVLEAARSVVIRREKLVKGGGGGGR